MEVLALASLASQEFGSNVFWYYLNHPSRHYLRPSVLFRHENLIPRENWTAQLQLAPAWRLDSQSLGFDVYFGPTVNLEKTIRGLGPDFKAFLTLGATAKLTDHYFELFATNPQRGFQIALEATAATQGLASDFTAQSFKLTAQKLWNIGNLLPPLFVIGWRGSVGMTFTSESITSPVLPSNYRHFLGGSRDVRGFSLQELPGNEFGAKMAISTGVELRWNDNIPLGLQPLVFADIGALGSDALIVDTPLYWSPGVGMRLPTPIGVFRTTLSHGFLIGDKGSAKPTHWQFLISYGEEF